MTKTFCPYQANGYSNRKEYLDDLAGYWEQPDMQENVYMLADLLGENEDFDGLIIALEEMAEFIGNEYCHIQWGACSAPYAFSKQ